MCKERFQYYLQVLSWYNMRIEGRSADSYEQPKVGLALSGGGSLAWHTSGC
jgi:hypothetical protein